MRIKAMISNWRSSFVKQIHLVSTSGKVNLPYVLIKNAPLLKYLPRNLYRSHFQDLSEIKHLSIIHQQQFKWAKWFHLVWANFVESLVPLNPKHVVPSLVCNWMKQYGIHNNQAPFFFLFPPLRVHSNIHALTGQMCLNQGAFPCPIWKFKVLLDLWRYTINVSIWPI